MKPKKYKLIILQIIAIILVNYLIVIDSGFIYKTHWKPTYIFALAFFHIGTFCSLYASMRCKELTTQKREVIYNYNAFVYLSFLALLFWHNCHVATDNLVFNYSLGLPILFMAVILLYDTYISFKVYQLSKNIIIEKIIE